MLSRQLKKKTKRKIPIIIENQQNSTLRWDNASVLEARTKGAENLVETSCILYNQ